MNSENAYNALLDQFGESRLAAAAEARGDINDHLKSTIFRLVVQHSFDDGFHDRIAGSQSKVCQEGQFMKGMFCIVVTFERWPRPIREFVQQ